MQTMGTTSSLGSGTPYCSGFPAPSLAAPLMVSGDLTQARGFKYHLHTNNPRIYTSSQDLSHGLLTRRLNCLLHISRQMSKASQHT